MGSKFPTPPPTPEGLAAMGGKPSTPPPPPPPIARWTLMILKPKTIEVERDGKTHYVTDYRFEQVN